MTRINVGVAPEELTRQHLLAELREIKRIPNKLKSGKYILKDLPTTFTLGKGHEKFFIDKVKYLHNRYLGLRTEALSRGYNVSDFSDAFSNIPLKYYNDYTPTMIDREIILQRINERLKK
jgi:deoxyribonuclease (pyrimidine dimer)